MINTLIVDDDEKGRDVLQILLEENCPEINIVGMAENMSSALDLIKSLNPELIFLDIEMPGGSGFELLERISDRKIHVVFVSAYDEYALKAFKFSPLHYLLKPVGIDELIDAVDKAKIALENDSSIGNVSIINKNTTGTGNCRLALGNHKGFAFVEIKDIERCEASGKFTICYFTDNKEIVVTKNLKEFEKTLIEYNFIRIHNSHLINFEYIKEYNKGNGGYVVMKSGASIPVSQRKKGKFLKYLYKI